MRTLPAALILLSSLAAPSLALAQSTSVTVDKVRYCRSIWPFCNDTTDPEYHAWADFDVPDSSQKQTYIARYNEPARENTENIVFLAAGTRLGDSGDPTWVTGQTPWEGHAGREHQFGNTIQDNSLAYRIFSQGIYSRSNTFVGLGFDSRYRGGFQDWHLDRIVNAHFAWLTSKVDPAKLKSVYLAGHSRSGALVLRLARKFKEAFPDVPVIVDAIEPVARAYDCWVCTGDDDRDRLGMSIHNGYINNPTVNFPANTGGLNDKGNWSWKTDLQAQFPNKTYLALNNYLNGGHMPASFPLNIPQETRSLTHMSGNERFLDLGWLYQEWFPVPHDAAWHVQIAQDAGLGVMDLALDRLRDRLDMFARNIAPQATATASSTFDGYAAGRVNDKNLDSRLGGDYSWANAGYSQDPQWLQLRWPNAVRTDYVEIISSEGYPLQRFELQYLDPATNAWVAVTPQQGYPSKLGVTTRLYFDAVTTSAMRLVDMAGPEHQPGFFRVNEILVRNAPETLPNIAPRATASAFSTYSGYSPAKANDGDANTALGGEYSWANGGYEQNPADVWFELAWPSAVRTSMIQVHSTQGYALRGFDVQYFNGSGWVPVPSRVSSTLDTTTTVSFDEVQTTRLRLINFVGPANQAFFYRINEFQVFGR
ncbi:hypothetical protein [Luteimonas aquatica]|uniref:hypothetical protein n=1 Tax=Luteimonas aquatica TaxID=450364 RepID=UPI001F57F4E0|nr:hypothetical protein [Luteimonas aquatica]